jgi:hypothetical protein
VPAFLELLTPGFYLLRAGPQAVAYGDPYTTLGVIVDKGDGACEIKGFIRQSDVEPDLSVFRDVGACLRRAGFRKYTWDRQAAGGFRHVAVGQPDC